MPGRLPSSPPYYNPETEVNPGTEKYRDATLTGTRVKGETNF